MEMPICPSQLTAVDASPCVGLMDTCHTFSVGLGYPHTPVTPTFLPSDPLADGMASPSFGSGSVASPFPSAPCDCLDMQLFHMNRLNYLLAESVPVRFDHSLQTIKLTFCACRVFLQCDKCDKSSANLLLVISVLNLTLQLFEYWIPRETSRVHRTEYGLGLRYGYYEVCQEENRQIRSFLLRGLLLQCREVLSILTTFISTSCPEVTKLPDNEDSTENKLVTGEASSQTWMLPDKSQVTIPDLDPDAASSAPGGNCLLPIIAGYEATVEAFLQSVSANECICGSKLASQDEKS